LTAKPRAGEDSGASHASVALVVSTAIGAALYSFYYDRFDLPPQLPFGTFGLVVGGDVLPMLVVPLGVGVLLLRERPGRLGFAWPGGRRVARHALAAYAALLPFVLWLASRAEFQAFYPSPAFPPAREHAVGLAFLWALHHAPQLLATEFCFRGFLLLPLARARGIGLALGVQTGLYVLLHASKPPLELAQAAWAGLVFGTVAWRTGSLWPAFAAHWAVAVTMDALCFAALHG
jgi:membrane protease YdiL (CAAX protease family)